MRRDTGIELLEPSGITGVQSTARWFVPETETLSILVRLEPVGAYVLLGQPMSDLADRHVALDLLLPGIRSLEERLAGVGPNEAAERLQRWLLEQIARHGREAHPDLLQAMRRINATEGRERIEAVADAIGVGRRRMERLFRLHIGIGPKEFGSLLRFGRLVRELGCTPWADLAADAGFADQAHFIREFKRRTGVTPTEFQRDSHS